MLTISGCTAGVQAGITDDEFAQIQTEVDKYLSVSDPEGLLRALLVSHGGELVIERYAESTADDYWNVRSVTKSIMSMLVGIAIADGSIESVDSTLGELLPSFAADLTPEVAAIALRDVLTHTAGLTYGDGLANADYKAANLTGWNFAGQNLTNAFFASGGLVATLTNANFSQANLRNADFWAAAR